MGIRTHGKLVAGVLIRPLAGEETRRNTSPWTTRRPMARTSPRSTFMCDGYGNRRLCVDRRKLTQFTYRSSCIAWLLPNYRLVEVVLRLCRRCCTVNKVLHNNRQTQSFKTSCSVSMTTWRIVGARIVNQAQPRMSVLIFSSTAMPVTSVVLESLEEKRRRKRVRQVQEPFET